jgi:hypothetical protein
MAVGVVAPLGPCVRGVPIPSDTATSVRPAMMSPRVNATTSSDPGGIHSKFSVNLRFSLLYSTTSVWSLPMATSCSKNSTPC